MFAIKKVGGIAFIKWMRLEAGQRSERRRSPLPSIAEQIVNAERARAVGMIVDGCGVPTLMVEIAMRRLGLMSPQGYKRSRPSGVPYAARCHCSSVGSFLPAQRAYAEASAWLT